MLVGDLIASDHPLLAITPASHLCGAVVPHLRQGTPPGLIGGIERRVEVPKQLLLLAVLETRVPDRDMPVLSPCGIPLPPDVLTA